MTGLGLPAVLLLSAGQEADVTYASALLDAVPAEAKVEAVIADKGYDSQAVVAQVEAKGAEAVIPTLKTRAVQRTIDRQRYKDRNLAERFWRRVQEFRRVATRYDKTARNFLAFVHLASIMVLLC